MNLTVPPVDWLRNGTTAIPIVRPDAANPIGVASGAGAWVYGAWAQIVAAADLAAHLLVGTLFRPGTLGDDFQIQIGVGAAGAEVVVASFPYDSLANAFASVTPVLPFVQIPANARVAARAASALGGSTVQTKLLFIPRPLT